MKANIYILILVFVLIGCKKDDGSPVGPTVIATEDWSLAMDNDTSSHGEQTLEKKSDGTVAAEGGWYFVSQGLTLQCPFSDGTATISDTNISMIVHGIARYPGAPAGYQTSAFTLSANGGTFHGRSSGTFSFTYSTYGWPSGKSGTFNGVRTNGNGVTN
ncbi:MAG: hypothetical protein WBZ48_11400 [Bacteroidota bacterium]